MPGNFDAPSDVLMRELSESPRWRDRLGGRLRHADAVLTPGAYLRRLTGLGREVDAWETTYQHLLTGDDSVLTGLRARACARSSPPSRTTRRPLEPSSPSTGAAPRGLSGDRARHGLPFRRIFAVARKGGDA
ncbi:Trans-aconitate 2-methyltransferase OS=Streptomyces alboniger OX=132473 GN=tam PE=3 SV=1 [Streptomyces alboniger]